MRPLKVSLSVPLSELVHWSHRKGIESRRRTRMDAVGERSQALQGLQLRQLLGRTKGCFGRNQGKGDIVVLEMGELFQSKELVRIDENLIWRKHIGCILGVQRQGRGVARSVFLTPWRGQR